MANKVSFADYPAPPGSKPSSLCDIAGPTSYTAVTNGTAPATPTGGQSIPASAFGLVGLELVDTGGSQSGTYIVQAFLVPFGQNVLSTSVILRWCTAATGAEVAGATNLSAEVVRLRAIGR